MCPFHFNPTIDHIQLKLTDFNLQNDTRFSKNMQFWQFLIGDASALSNFITQQDDHGWTANANTIAGNHRAGWITGDRGDDFYFCSTILLNGWTVEDILFTRAAPNGSDGADANIWEDRKGTSMPYIRVHWFDTPSYKKVDYFVTYIITGPKGVPYNKNQTPSNEMAAMTNAHNDWQSVAGASQGMGGSSTTPPK